MIHRLFNRLPRRSASERDLGSPPTETPDDRHWHGSSFDLAHGLEVTEVVPALGNGRRPSAIAVFHDTLPFVHDTAR